MYPHYNKIIYIKNYHQKRSHASIWNKNCNNDTNTCANGINARI